MKQVSIVLEPNKITTSTSNVLSILEHVLLVVGLLCTMYQATIYTSTWNIHDFIKSKHVP